MRHTYCIWYQQWCPTQALSYLGVKPGGKNICFPQLDTHSPKSGFFGFSHDTSLFCHIVCLPGLFIPPFKWWWSCLSIPAHCVPGILVAGSHTSKGSIPGSCWRFYDCSIQCWFVAIFFHISNTVFMRTVRGNVACDHSHRRHCHFPMC